MKKPAQPVYKPTAEELKQRKLEEDEKQRGKRKAEHIGDQSFLIRRGEDHQAQLGAIYRDLDFSQRQESLLPAQAQRDYVSRHLLHPLFIRMRSHSCQANLATSRMNEKENIVGDQSLECDNFDGEGIGPCQSIQMRTDEVFPIWGVLPLGGGWNIVTNEDIAVRLIG